MTAHPRAKVHTYGKAPRPGRKVGHITLRRDGLEALEEGLARLSRLVSELPWEGRV